MESVKPTTSTKNGRGRNPRSLANLRKWKAGESGNPTGRPKRDPLTERLREFAEQPADRAVCEALKLPAGST